MAKTSGIDRRDFVVGAAEFWPVMPPDQTSDRVRERILEFGRAHRA